VSVQPLTRFPLDVPARIVQVAVDDARRSDRLAGLGLIPGSVVLVVQRRPAFVVEVGETTLALGEEVAEHILVEPLEDGKNP
jgi:Fe2+ transport system protein FeoA